MKTKIMTSLTLMIFSQNAMHYVKLLTFLMLFLLIQKEIPMVRRYLRFAGYKKNILLSNDHLLLKDGYFGYQLHLTVMY